MQHTTNSLITVRYFDAIWENIAQWRGFIQRVGPPPPPPRNYDVIIASTATITKYSIIIDLLYHS